MIVQSLLWIWLRPYSTRVIQGVQKGGQVHIAFGHSADQIKKFFFNSSVKKVGHEWKFQLEQYEHYPSHRISFYENPRSNKRASECRIPAQAPTSSMRYPLWENLVLQLSSGQQPEQCIIFLRDEQDRYHARVLSIDEIRSQMPDNLAKAIRATRNTSQAGICQEDLVYEDSGVITLPDVETTDRVRPPKHALRQRRLDLDSFEEGFKQEISLEKTYRNPDFARKVKERDHYTCVICGFNFFATYGERGRNFAECHHLVSFRDLKGRRISTLDEAITVCSNCHSMLHRANELLTPEELKRMLILTSQRNRR